MENMYNEFYLWNQHLPLKTKLKLYLPCSRTQENISLKNYNLK